MVPCLLMSAACLRLWSGRQITVTRFQFRRMRPASMFRSVTCGGPRQNGELSFIAKESTRANEPGVRKGLNALETALADGTDKHATGGCEISELIPMLGCNAHCPDAFE